MKGRCNNVLKLVTLDVFIIFTVIAFVLGGIIGVFLMCCLIVGADSEKDRGRKNGSNAGKQDSRLHSNK